MAEADPSAQLAPVTTRKDFDSERSAVLDAFARLEQIINELSDGASRKVSLGQKLEKIAGHLPSELVEQAQALCDVRNDIVHGTLRMIPGRPAYCVYLNSAEAVGKYPVARMLTLDQHKQLAREVRASANSMKLKLPQSTTLRD